MAFDPKEFLAESSTPAAESKFDPNEFVGSTEQPEETIPQPGTPAPQFAVPGPTGINPGEVVTAVKPLGEAAMNIGRGYVRHPLEAIADVAAMHMGMPPPIASLKGLQGVGQMYQGVKDTLNNTNFKLGALQDAGPEIRQAFDNVVGKLPANIKDDIAKYGADALKSAQLPEHLLNDATFMSSWNALKGQVPTTMQKIGAIAGPVARGISKVAGPAGLALNAYDAAQYAQDAQLGQRLAQGQGRLAQHAYRQLPSQINTPNNPQPGTPQFAALQQQYAPAKAVVQPQASQQTNINDAIRIAAAKKALGQ